MKIRKLEICGFKSFVDRTVIRFDQEVTGIVGPNGCGKSNVVDAVKWVMGEQSAQRLRGRAMEDVIFNGSEARGPHGFAEVTVTFDNTDGLTPPEYRDYAEITVTRRLERSGRSDYFINKTPVRLMDVTNLFLGTGVGRRAYSIIEQGRIGFIVSSKAEDRRLMIEEAAGITKFKSKKKAAERKMDQTRQNLLRVTDIIQEIERSLASLKRQAQKAERYKQYRAELRDLELHVASHRYLELHAHQRVVHGRRVTAEAEVEGVRRALRVEEAELEAQRIETAGAESAVEQGQNRAYGLDNDVRRREGELETQLERLAGLREKETVAERELAALADQRAGLEDERAHLLTALAELEDAERAEADALAQQQEALAARKASADDAEKVLSSARARLAEAGTRIARAEAVRASVARRRDEAGSRLERLRSDQSEARAQLAEAEREAGVLRARHEGLLQGKATTGERRSELEAELTELRAEASALDETVAALRDELSERRSRLRSLEQLQQRFEGVGTGVRTLMARQDGDGLLGLVADRIDCPAELTAALAAALGDQLQGVVVDGRDAAVDALRHLREGRGGRATLFPRHPRRTVGADAGDARRAAALGLPIRRLADHVGFAADDEALVRHLLGGWWVADDLTAALAAHDAGFGPVVSRAGEVVGEDGRLVGGSADEVNAHLLEVQREVRELREIVADLDLRHGEAAGTLGGLRERMATSQAALDAARSEAHDAELALVAVEKDLRASEQAQERTDARIAQLGREIDDLGELLTVAEREQAEAQQEHAQAEAARDEAAREVEAAGEVHDERRQAVEAEAARVTELKVRAAQARERVERDRAAVERVDRSLAELGERGGRLRGDVLAGAEQQGRIAAAVLADRETLVERVAEAMAAQEALAELRARYDALRAALGEREATLRSIRGSLDERSATLSELALEEREVDLAMSHLLESMAERHRVDLPRVLGDYHARELPDAAIDARIEELIRLIERMGQINLTAIEEYEQTSERYEYLKAQRQDLEDALTQLDRAIRQMNRESRRLFKETFEAVDALFRKMFPVLFGGGKARLELTDPDDLLETGIEIIAQPPGKKLGSLELMSGGEKALTAVSLLLAIFQHKPSPFCILDEVDAPLDEANVGRFASSVRSMTDHSQFIVITHAKRTMEYADVLYGVTMEQPGISKVVSVELTGPGAARTTSGGQQVAVA